MTVVIAVAYILGNMLLPYRLLYAVVATWIVCHVLKQQYGIARGMCQLPESVFKLLLTLSVAAWRCHLYQHFFEKQPGRRPDCLD